MTLHLELNTSLAQNTCYFPNCHPRPLHILFPLPGCVHLSEFGLKIPQEAFPDPWVECRTLLQISLMGLFASAAGPGSWAARGWSFVACTLSGSAYAPSDFPGGNALTRVQASPRTVRAERRWSRSGRRAGKSVSARSDPGNIYGLLEGWSEGGGGLGCPAGGERRALSSPAVPGGGPARAERGSRAPNLRARPQPIREATAAWN